MPILRQGQAISGPDGVYEVIVPPSNNVVNNVPTNAVAIVGTATYGPVNVPVSFADSSGLKFNFGGVGLGQYDLPTEAAMAMKQGCNNFVGVRVTDGTDVAASAVLSDGTNAIANDQALYTGTGGNGFTRQVSVGTNSTSQTTPTSYKVTITRPNYQPEVFDNLPATGFQAAYVKAIMQGQSGLRGPSQIIKSAYPTVSAPAAPTLTSAGTGGTIPAGTYYAKVTYTTTASQSGVNLNATTSGETTASAESTSVTTTGATSTITVNFGTIPTNATGVKVYLTPTSASPGSEVFAVSATTGTSIAITALPGAGAATPPATNNTALVNSTAPALTTATFSGGTDGASGVGTTQLVGTDGLGAARTGMYALRGAAKAGLFLLAGCTDTTTWSTMLSFGQSQGAAMIPVVCFPTGTSTASAIASKQSVGAQDWQIIYTKDWFSILDTDNNVQRLVSPMGMIAGFIANLSPEQSPANKPMSGFIGTDRSLSGVSYDPNELSQLEVAGILVATNPIPYGKVWGLAHGRNGATDPTVCQISYSRMTLMIALTQEQALGRFIGKLQGTASNDPTRMAAKAMMDEYMGNLAAPNPLTGYGMIQDFKNVADGTLNTPTTVAQGLAIGYSQVSYLGVVEKFVWYEQGGTAMVIKH